MSSILSPLEQDILRAFFALDGAEAFVLTGGAALAEYYLQHRLSQDLDLFTLDEQVFVEIGDQLSELASKIGAEERPIRSLTTLNQVIFAREGQEIKVDIVRDSGPAFGEPRQVDVVRVDSLENIGANKVTALLGRAAFRDYIDLYFILREGGLTFEHLVALAKRKDTGLQEFYLAGWIKQQTPKLHTPPTMLKAVDFEEMKRYFLQLANELMAKQNPEEPHG
ncbi:MAG: nucleotidyl transferase AbiEii/AbiGii toxin family protein [Chloroflexi bacterium]|nr:nucleotidyl transferase AbiEii/AbiGii toxin family protein [Chloroflexota bacterium]MBI3762119.1 nucleotidyl transferase AbiEii/AbiGii toxin family protein [Chloroflexota bacterium]